MTLPKQKTRLLTKVLFMLIFILSLISLSLFYISSTVIIPLPIQESPKLNLGLTNYTLGQIIDIDTLSQFGISNTKTLSETCHLSEDIMRRHTNIEWREIKHVKTKTPSSVFEKTLLQVHIGVNNTGQLGYICGTGILTEISDINKLKNEILSLTPHTSYMSLPNDSVVYQTEATKIYPRNYTGLGNYLKSIRHELLSELDGERMAFEIQRASLHIHKDNSYQIQYLDQKVIPTISANEKAYKIGRLEDAFEMFELKFLATQLENDKFTNSLLILKIYMYLGAL